MNHLRQTFGDRRKIDDRCRLHKEIFTHSFMHCFIDPLVTISKPLPDYHVVNFLSVHKYTCFVNFCGNKGG